jgi:hypothetical protein
MSRFYENQFKTRFYGVTMKLSLLLIALLVGYSTTYAQSGRTVTVSNDNELIEAMYDPSIDVIKLEEGKYSFLDIEVLNGSENRIFKAHGTQGGSNILSSCIYFINTKQTCWEDENTVLQLEAGTINGPCPADNSGVWEMTNGPGNETYLGSTNMYLLDVTVSEPGIYEFQYTWPNGRYVKGDYLWYDTPVITFDAPDEYCIDDDLTIDADFTVSIPEPNLYFYWDYVGTASATIVPGLVSGTWDISVDQCGLYTFTFTVVNGPCVAEEVFTIEFYDTPVISIQDDEDVCMDELPYELTASSTALCDYPRDAEWTLVSGPQGATVTITVNSVEVSLCGEYVFEYTVSNGPCEASETVTINFYDVPVITIQDDAEVCLDELPYALTASYDVSCDYPADAEWTLVSGPQGATVTITVNSVEVSLCGEYVFEYTVSNGPCEASETVTINFYDVPVITIQDDAEVCLDELPYALTASYDVSCDYPADAEWTLVSGPQGATVTITVNSVEVSLCGEYVFEYTVSNGPCEASETVTINFYDVPVITIQDDAEVCLDELPYALTASYDVSCDYPADAEWTLVSGPQGATVTITVNSVEVSLCGEYVFEYTVSNGPCEASETVTINFYDVPVITIQDDAEVCLDELPYALTASYDVSCDYPADAEWTLVSGPQGATVTITVNSVEVSLCGEYVFEYTVSNGPCEASETVTINFYDVPVITIQDDAEVCLDELPYALTASYDVSCDYPADAEWTLVSGPQGATVTITVNSVEVSLCGEYVFEYTVSNGPCEASETVTINFYDVPVITIQDDAEVCLDELPYALTASYDVSCDYPADAEWTLVSGPQGATVTITVNSVEVSLCGEYVFEYTVSNGPCEASETVTINFYDVPVITIQDDAEVCLDELPYALTASYDVSCDYPADAEWTLVSGPQGATVTITVNSVEVSLCGEYVFEYTVSNGPCEASETVTINFYDVPVITIQDDAEVCLDELPYALTASYDVSCDYPADAEWTLVSGPQGATVTITVNSVEVSLCGEYVFEYTVSNGPCEASETVTINFYDVPVITIQDDAEVCLDELPYALTASYDVSCDYPADAEWTLVSGPQGATVTITVNSVEVSLCGEYVFEYTVSNGPCEASETVTIYFYDVPSELVVNTQPEVCGYSSFANVSYEVFCPGDGEVEQFITPKGGNPGTATVTYNESNDNWEIQVDWCGEYTFTYKVVNGLCDAEKEFSITFYEEPVFEIKGEEDPILCREYTYYIEDLRECDFGTVSYTWSVIGGYFTSSYVGVDEVTVIWTTPSEASITATGVIYDECFGDDELFVSPQYPTLAGQVKYWNEFETFMPSPFPTQDYATYPHDYFYVELWGVPNITKNGDPELIKTVKVEPTIKEDVSNWNLTELMSYFEFDLSEIFVLDQWEGTIYEIFGCTGYFLKIWDGGLWYYDMADEPWPPQPIAATHLGNNYTYNNWGGVNATDALAILNMVTNELTVFPWVGPQTWLPKYGYFSHSAADVNSSNPFGVGIGLGLTALDALTTSYRAISIIDVFPNSQPGIEYSPNFRVTGRMVPDLTYTVKNGITFDVIDEVETKTFHLVEDSGFDYTITSVTNDVLSGTPTVDNPDDVPFVHSQNSYLYFTSATDHKYRSAPLSLQRYDNIHIYYLALGDINSSYVPTSAGFGKDAQPIELAYTDEIAVRKGDIATVPIRISHGADVAAISLNMTYNSNLIEIVDVNFEEDNYNVDEKAGKLRIGWFTQDPVYYSAGDAVALITVRVLDDIVSDVRLFELEAGTELADIDAMVIEGIKFDTDGLNTTTSVGQLNDNDLFVTNYPNPFRNSTIISYYLPEASTVQLVVFNKMGQAVETLVDESQAAGAHKVEFNRTDLLPGVYYYKIVVSGDAGIFTETNSMILIR